MEVGSADEFYCLMGELSQHMMMGELLDGDTMVKVGVCGCVSGYCVGVCVYVFDGGTVSTHDDRSNVGLVCVSLCIEVVHQ